MQRAAGLEDALEPVELMAEAVRAAAADAGLAAVPPARLGPGGATCCRGATATRPGSWPTSSASRPRETAYTTAGGNTPQLLVNATAAEIQRGELDLAVLAGGECWRTRMRARRTDAAPRLAQAARGHRPDRGSLGDEWR